MVGVEKPSWVIYRLNWVFSTPPPIRKSNADVKSAPKEKRIDTISRIFQLICKHDLPVSLKKPDVISVFIRKNQAKKDLDFKTGAVDFRVVHIWREIISRGSFTLTITVCNVT